jgi:hypothetical protein
MSSFKHNYSMQANIVPIGALNQNPLPSFSPHQNIFTSQREFNQHHAYSTDFGSFHPQQQKNLSAVSIPFFPGSSIR